VKVLVTGAGGQVGRALLASAPPGWRCIGLDRAALDLADEAAVRSLVGAHRPDVVVNAGAYTAVDAAEADELQASAINARAPGVLGHVLAGWGGRLVQLSTDFVFDGMSSAPYRPDARRNPLSAYGRTKAEGEDMAGPQALVVRTSWVHAAGGGNFVRTMLRLMRDGCPVRVVADQIGAPTWATGLAETLWALVETDATGIFHHRDAGVASWYDLAVAVQEEALAIGLLQSEVPVLPIATADYPTSARRPAFSVLDDSATRAFLGDRPAHWRVNLRRMLLEEKARG